MTEAKRKMLTMFLLLYGTDWVGGPNARGRYRNEQLQCVEFKLYDEWRRIAYNDDRDFELMAFPNYSAKIRIRPDAIARLQNDG
jgi:hypothetical protein